MPFEKSGCGSPNSTRESSALELAKRVRFGEKRSDPAGRKKSYAALTKTDLRGLKKLAEQLEDFKLFKALCDKDLDELQTIEALWIPIKRLPKATKPKFTPTSEPI